MGTQPPYDPQQVYNPPPPPYGYPPPASPGLSDNVAGALAYITIIPAIIFLFVEPYSRRPFVRFHAIQCLLLAAAGVAIHFFWIIPILGWIVAIVGTILIGISWLIAIIGAASGKAWRIPILGDFAAQQAGL
jgi:uncharacterized membrane protein